MCSAHAHRLLGLLLGFAVGCSHQKNATGEGRADGVAPASAVPHSVMTLSNNQPLCMVDDVPVDIAHGASLRSINPRDIASIEVVQDPAGTAMYGVRGANGVIVIRTKRPGQ